MITKTEALVEMRAIMESALKEILVVSRKVDQEYDEFVEAISFKGAHNGLKEALWLIEYEMKLVKVEVS